jgi:hypothetical protein
MAASPETLTNRLWMVGALFETGVAIMRQNIRRASPEISEEEVDRRLGEWLRKRPGAEQGDAEGRVIPWPRR